MFNCLIFTLTFFQNKLSSICQLTGFATGRARWRRPAPQRRDDCSRDSCANIFYKYWKYFSQILLTNTFNKYCTYFQQIFLLTIFNTYCFFIALLWTLILCCDIDNIPFGLLVNYWHWAFRLCCDLVLHNYYYRAWLRLVRLKINLINRVRV